MELPEITASRIASEVRTYVRDNFTPGSLESLHNLQLMVAGKVMTALLEMRSFMCIACGKMVEVEKVRCGGCSEAAHA